MNTKIGEISPGGVTVGFVLFSSDKITGEYEPMTVKADKELKVHPSFVKGDPELLRTRLHALLDGFIDDIIDSKGKNDKDVPKVWNPS